MPICEVKEIHGTTHSQDVRPLDQSLCTPDRFSLSKRKLAREWAVVGLALKQTGLKQPGWTHVMSCNILSQIFVELTCSVFTGVMF